MRQIQIRKAGKATKRTACPELDLRTPAGRVLPF